MPKKWRSIKKSFSNNNSSKRLTGDGRERVADEQWDVIFIGAGQNSFALGTYLGKAGLKTVICESRLENGGRLASEEITLPGYWHNTLAYFQDNRELLTGLERIELG